MEKLFSERNSSYKKIKSNKYSEEFRITIINILFNQYCISDKKDISDLLNILKELMDFFCIEQPIYNKDSSILLRRSEENIKNFIKNCSWEKLFDFIEQALIIGIKNEEKCIEKYNNMFRYHGCKYRILNKIIIPTMTDLEMKEISKAMNTGIDSVDTAYNEALKLFSVKVEKPDYNAVVAKSSNAVEAMVVTIAKDNGSSKDTLGKALTDIKNKGIYIDEDMENIIRNFYKYTCNSGIRHGGDTTTTVKEFDARLMLVLSATFINYLNAIK